MAGGKQSKNARKNKQFNTKKQFDGKDIDPILYYGVHAGHGKYVSAKFSGSNNLVTDESGKPLPWDEIQ
jgi:hypothetical protein